MNILTKSIMLFLQVLNVSWDGIEELQGDLDFIGYSADWLQGNWENIVEAAVMRQVSDSGEGIYLEPYAEGADYYPGSSRILEPTKLPTHAVYCRPKSGRNLYDCINEVTVECPLEGYALEEFVCFKDEWYYRRPPFNHALLQSPYSDFVVDIETVEFSLYFLQRTN